MRASGSPRSHLLRALVVLGLSALVAAAAPACSNDSGGGPAADVDLSRSEAVSFPAADDGPTLEGRLFEPSGGAAPAEGQEHAGVVLSHMLPADQSSWWPFAELLADEGYTALTYNFRGYCPEGRAGCSGGDKDIDAIWRDVAGAAEFLRGRGVGRVALIGASMGGTASLVAAGGAQPPAGPVDAVITLSAPITIEGLTATSDVLQSDPAAKLFLAGVGDADAADAAQQLYEQASAPKRVEIVPADDHGTDLLTGPRGEEVRRLMLITLEQHTGEEGS